MHADLNTESVSFLSVYVLNRKAEIASSKTTPLTQSSVLLQPKGFRRYSSSPLLIQEQFGCIREVMPIGEVFCTLAHCHSISCFVVF